jgi:endonuclease YncB( thermonuclease family)
VTGTVEPGWYPDYEAPPGHQRYWDGERWTDQRSVRPVDEASSSAPAISIAGWVWVALAALVVVSAIVLVVGDDRSAQSGSNASSTPAGPTVSPTEQAQPEPDAPSRRTWQVSAVVDGTTVRLSNGAEVRLVGIEDVCAAEGLEALVAGRTVMLTRRGLDKDPEGRLLRYVERNGTDVGKRLIQRGWATASDEPHPRSASYRRADERSPANCS